MLFVVDDFQITLRRRPYARRTSLTVKLNGEIQLSAPVGASLRELHKFVHQHRPWIETSLEKYARLRALHPRQEMRQGDEFPFLGVPRRLRYQLAARGKFEIVLHNEDLLIEIPERDWRCFDPFAAHPEFFSGLRKFYSLAGRRFLSERVAHFAARMHLFPNHLRFGAQKTRWGSCSSRGQLSFNWKLIFAPREVIDYVVVHELAHLRFHNHSKSFWALVATEIPDYKLRKRWLNENQLAVEFLSEARLP